MNGNQFATASYTPESESESDPESESEPKFLNNKKNTLNSI